MAARFGAGNDALARLVREQQDSVSELRALDKSLLEELTKSPDQRNRARENSFRKRIAELDQQLRRLNDRLAIEFPDYAALVSPGALKLEDVQKLLGPDEALVFWHVGQRESHVFALTREGAEWKGFRSCRMRWRARSPSSAAASTSTW